MKLVLKTAVGRDLTADLGNFANRVANEGLIETDYSIEGKVADADLSHGEPMGFYAVLDFVLQNPELVLGLFGHFTTLIKDIYGEETVEIKVETPGRAFAFKGPSRKAMEFLEQVLQSEGLFKDAVIEVGEPGDGDA